MFNPWVRKIPWRGEWQPIPVFLPGESHEWRSLAGYSPWRRKELDMTEQLTLSNPPLFLLLLHQLHLRSSGIRFWRLGTPGEGKRGRCPSTWLQLTPPMLISPQSLPLCRSKILACLTDAHGPERVSDLLPSCQPSLQAASCCIL